MNMRSEIMALFLKAICKEGDSPKRNLIGK